MYRDEMIAVYNEQHMQIAMKIVLPKEGCKLKNQLVFECMHVHLRGVLY